MNLVESFGLVLPVRFARPGERKFGVPDGGPLDGLSYRLAAALAGQAENVWEVVGGRAVFHVAAPTWVVVLGAEGPLVVDGLRRTARNGRHRVQRELVIEAPTHGWTTYVAPARRPGALALGHPETLDATHPLRICPSPDDFDQAALTSRPWSVSLTSDRRGWRLEGAPIAILPQGQSEMAVPGLVQLPPGGQPIVIGPDGPTVGGYAKLGTIIAPDIFALAQKRPGTPVEFASVTWEEARQAVSTFEAALNETTARLAWL